MLTFITIMVPPWSIEAFHRVKVESLLVHILMEIIFSQTLKMTQFLLMNMDILSKAN